MARTKQTARIATGGKAPRKNLATKQAGKNDKDEFISLDSRSTKHRIYKKYTSNKNDKNKHQKDLDDPEPQHDEQQHDIDWSQQTDCIEFTSPAHDIKEKQTDSINTNKSGFTTKHIQNEPLFYKPIGKNGAGYSLRAPLPHEPLWDQDVLHCYFHGHLKRSTARTRHGDDNDDDDDGDYYPDQPEDDYLIYLPFLNICRFVRFYPYCFINQRTRANKNAKIESKWVFREHASAGMIIQVTTKQWSKPNQHIPVYLLIDLHNIVQFPPTTWRTHINQFVLFHHLRLADTAPHLLPSYLCQFPDCPHSARHFTTDQPCYGVCKDHLTHLISISDHEMESLPNRYTTNRLSDMILHSSSSSSLTKWIPRRENKRIFFQFLSGMNGVDHTDVYENFFNRVASHQEEGNGHTMIHYEVNTQSGGGSRFRRKVNTCKEAFAGILYHVDIMSIHEDSRFYNSSNFIHFIAVMMHANGAGKFIVGNKSVKTFDVNDFGIAFCEVLCEIPPVVNCPIVVYVASCSHQSSTFDSIVDALDGYGRTALKDHLYFLYFATNAYFHNMSTLGVSFLNQLMSSDCPSVEKAFWDTAAFVDHKLMSPRLLAPKGLIHIPFPTISNNDVIANPARMIVSNPFTVSASLQSIISTSSSSTAMNIITSGYNPFTVPSSSQHIHQSTPFRSSPSSSSSSSTAMNVTNDPSVVYYPVFIHHSFGKKKKKKRKNNPGKETRRKRKALLHGAIEAP